MGYAAAQTVHRSCTLLGVQSYLLRGQRANQDPDPRPHSSAKLSASRAAVWTMSDATNTRSIRELTSTTSSLVQHPPFSVTWTPSGLGIQRSFKWPKGQPHRLCVIFYNSMMQF